MRLELSRRLVEKFLVSRFGFAFLDHSISDTQSPQVQALISQDRNSWHEAFAHINDKAVQQLEQEKAIQDMHIANKDQPVDCDVCDLGKMNRLKFASEIPARAEHPAEVIHADVAGKIIPATLFGEQYLIIVDEKSGYIFGHLAKKKNEVIDLFKAARLNYQCSAKVKIFVSDGGGEFCSDEFEQLLVKKGIIHSETPPNNPQRNGKAERNFKIIFDGVRVLLKAAQLPRNYWGEAAIHFIYCRNRTIKHGTNKTRFELLFGKQPSAKHLLPFGSPVNF